MLVYCYCHWSLHIRCAELEVFKKNEVCCITHASNCVYNCCSGKLKVLNARVFVASFM